LFSSINNSVSTSRESAVGSASIWSGVAVEVSRIALFKERSERFGSVVTTGAASTSRKSRDDVVEERVGTSTNVVKLCNCDFTNTTTVVVCKVKLDFKSCSLALESVLAGRVKFNSCESVNELSVGSIPPSQCADALSYREVKIVSNTNKLQSFLGEVKSERGNHSSSVIESWNIDWRLTHSCTAGSIIWAEISPTKWAAIRP
jgi:hypothetical protein